MGETNTGTEPLLRIQSAREQFEQFFAEFCDSINEQAQLPPEQQIVLMAQLKTSIEKRDQLGHMNAFCKGHIHLLREEEKRLAERRHRLEKFSEMLQSSLHQALLDMGVKRVEGNEYSFTVKKNPPRVEIVDEARIPPEFISYAPVIDKAAIKNSLEDGKEVPGAELVQSTRLDIR